MLLPGLCKTCSISEAAFIVKTGLIRLSNERVVLEICGQSDIHGSDKLTSSKEELF
jgi:hypothetical protein